MQQYSIEGSDGRKVTVMPGEKRQTYNLLATWTSSRSFSMITSLLAKVEKSEVTCERLTPEDLGSKEAYSNEVKLMAACMRALAPLMAKQDFAVGEMVEAAATENNQGEIEFKMAIQCLIEGVEQEVNAIAFLNVGRGVRIQIENNPAPSQSELGVALLAFGRIFLGGFKK
jgi:hypothetical protein